MREISKNIFFYRTPLEAVSVSSITLPKLSSPREVSHYPALMGNYKTLHSYVFDLSIHIHGLSPVTLLKKGLWHRCFPVNFAKFLGAPFFTEHLWESAPVPVRSWLQVCIQNLVKYLRWSFFQELFTSSSH